MPEFKCTLNELTIYKLSYPSWIEIISFYIDYRDCRYGLQGQDIAILVDGNNDKVYYAPDEGPSDCDIEEFTEITDGETLKIWEVNDYSGSRDVSCMCATPSIDSITSYNDHPKITWSHDDDPNGTYNYQIWRLLTQYTHPIGTWSLINTTSNKYYTDNDLNIGDGSWGRAYYKIRANINDLYSSYSGYDYINFEYFQKISEQSMDLAEINGEIKSFKLQANYPNPFNPEDIFCSV